jgi:glutathione reductase (NADPH)
VTLVYRGEQVLRGFDDDVRAHLRIELVKRGIDLRLHATGRVGRAAARRHAALDAAHVRAPSSTTSTR